MIRKAGGEAGALDGLSLKEALRRLPEELLAVVILRYFSGYTLEETAGILGIPRGTVTSRQKRALALLRLEYVIADKKQVNVFFTVEGELEEGRRWDVMARVDQEAYPYAGTGDRVASGELGYSTLSFTEGETPEELELTLTLKDYEEETPLLAEFHFSLELDPDLRSLGRTVKLNEAFQVDGQTLCLDSVELYPTHMRVNIAGDAENTAWLVYLELSITGDGRKVERIDNHGLSATGGGKASDGAISLYTASPWYYSCEELELTITGVTWLDKDRQETVVDLETGTATGLPDGVEYLGVWEENTEDEGLILHFQKPQDNWNYSFAGAFRDEADNSAESTFIGWSSWDEDAPDAPSQMYFGLGDYQGRWVTIENLYSRITNLTEPLVLTVPVK